MTDLATNGKEIVSSQQGRQLAWLAFWILVVFLLLINIREIRLTRSYQTAGFKNRQSIEQRNSIADQLKVVQSKLGAITWERRNRIAAYFSRLSKAKSKDDVVIAFPKKIATSTTCKQDRIRSFVYVPQGRHQLCIQTHDKKTLRINLTPKTCSEFRIEFDPSGKALLILQEGIRVGQIAIHDKKPLLRQRTPRLTIQTIYGQTKNSVNSFGVPGTVRIDQTIERGFGYATWRSTSPNTVFNANVNVHLRNKMEPDVSATIVCWIASDTEFRPPELIGKELISYENLLPFQYQFPQVTAFMQLDGDKLYAPEFVRSSDIEHGLFRKWQYVATEGDDIPPSPRDLFQTTTNSDSL